MTDHTPSASKDKTVIAQQPKSALMSNFRVRTDKTADIGQTDRSRQHERRRHTGIPTGQGLRGSKKAGREAIAMARQVERSEERT